MAASTVIKNFRDGTIVFADGTTPTPLSVTVTLEGGDFSLTGLNQGNMFSRSRSKCRQTPSSNTAQCPTKIRPDSAQVLAGWMTPWLDDPDPLI
jgi:hypothetical protein